MQYTEYTKPQYSMDSDGDFVIANYNDAKPFASFLPGIAGIEGIPMWVFYVNRGQCICSMGIQDKDHPMMEFLPANWAYGLVTSQGFRTFIKLADRSSGAFYEPFQQYRPEEQPGRVQHMKISSSGLALEETNDSLGLKFTVEYSTVPHESYAGLIRLLRVHNVGSGTVALEGLDGLPLIVPHGVNNFCLKNMRRTIEAFVEVCNLDNAAPFFKAKVVPADRPDVTLITSGNFYVGFEAAESGYSLVQPVVDPAKIFGSRLDFGLPDRFLADSSQDLLRDQSTEGRFPCAMGLFHTSLAPGETYTYYSILGHASALEELNTLIPRIATPEYARSRMHSNRDLIDSLTQSNLICSDVPALDHYARQNALDNLMRGGAPHTLKGSGSHLTLHLFSRKHGDLERDYNDFCLQPTYYSQGNGNFRDINQNRRCDLLTNPNIGESTVLHFSNFIQLDGFNPLVLKETRFRVTNVRQVERTLEEHFRPTDIDAVRTALEEPFTPGSVVMFLRANGIVLKGDAEAFLGQLLDQCAAVHVTDHGEGYWIDHWTYNLDLLENYLAIYPDKFANLLFASDKVTFHNSPYRVQPRSKKYVLSDGKPSQLGAVFFDEEKAAMIESFEIDRNAVRIDFGEGRVYRTSIFIKMLCIVANKLASLDPEGVGVEMEAGKPGWYDALNGLPGLFGSSISETLELKRHIQFLLEHLPSYEECDREIGLFEELHDLMAEVHRRLETSQSTFEYWDSTATAKEHFRERTRLGVSGNEVAVEVSTIRDFLVMALRKLDDGIEKARDQESRTIFTYFRHEVTDYEEMPSLSSRPDKRARSAASQVRYIRPLQFRQIPLPLFLEGPVHYLRCQPAQDVARAFATQVRKSALFDSALNMYKVNAPLADQPMGIGRARVFPPGWLENESVWLHMEYKYILELLRNGLFDEFYDAFKDICIPFLKPEMYGRSILENCSFIASSAHPDPSIHGNGFVARLSGATAEFIHIMALMTMGPRPFRVGPNGELELHLEPALPGWLFTRESRRSRILEGDSWREIEMAAGTFSFMFLGTIFVSYHNPNRRNTYGESGVAPSHWTVTGQDGRRDEFEGDILKGDIARQIRAREVQRIDIQLK